jgi:segregation and condensation protein B
VNREEKDSGGFEEEAGWPAGAKDDPAPIEPEPESVPEAEICETKTDEEGVLPSDDGGPGQAPDREPEGAAEGSLEAPGPRAEGSRLKSILEALIFVSEQPVSLDRMAGVLTDCSRARLKEILNELEQDYEARGCALEIVQVANGYQFRTRPEFASWIGRLRQQKFARLSRAALETLAIVAYRQPVTRAEAEAIRGVDSGAVLGTLLERRLLRILGRKEVAGRPILYGTTQEFLELFGLNSLKDLPTLKEIKDIVEQAERDAGEEGAREGEAAQEAGGAPGAAAAPAGEDAQAPGGEGTARRSEEEEDAGRSVDDFEDGGEWSEDEEPLSEEDFTPSKLDEVLKSTRTRLEHYQPDVEEEEEGGQTETEGGGEAGGGEEDVTGEEDGPDDD